MMRQTRTAVLYLAVVFAAGALFGAVAHSLFTQHTTRASSPKDMRARYVAKLQKELNLTPDQAKQIESISESTGQRFQEVRDRVSPEFAAIREEHRRRIMAVLTPEQQPKYKQIVEEHERRHEQGHPTASK